MASIKNITWYGGWILLGIVISTLLGPVSFFVKFIVGLLWIGAFLFLSKKLRSKNNPRLDPGVIPEKEK